MRNSLLLALMLAVPGLAGQSAEARGQQEVAPTLRERGQATQPVQPAAPPVDYAFAQNAQNTRQELQNLLWQLPPSVRRVLQNDPSLIDRPDYLAPYPALMAFLKQHPEIARNPTFFLGGPEEFNRKSEPLDIFAAVLAGTGLFLGFLTFIIFIGSMAREVVEYRRWARQTRMQIDVHTKILDRMQSNDDLLAYVQTPAGRNFLEFTPVSSGREPRMAGVPFGRILWSVQAGVVLAALGIGLRFARNTVPEEVVPAFTVLGIIVMSLGLGAVTSAVVAYFLSSRLGLLPSRKQETNA
jgi:hypothetical protein